MSKPVIMMKLGEPLKKYSLKASSLVESIVAIVIVTVCLLCVAVIFGNVVDNSSAKALLQGRQRVKEIGEEIRSNKDIRNDILEYEGYIIEKTVEQQSEQIKRVSLRLNVNGKTEETTFLINE